MHRTILVSGAFGNVGGQVVAAALAAGHGVVALDVASPPNRAAATRLGRVHAGSPQLDVRWVDLRDAAGVAEAVAEVAPDAIVHTAAVIPPVAYVQHELARAVNVDGTRHLLEAAVALERPPVVVFTSSVTVHGPRNAARLLPPLGADDPLRPFDNYGRHKVAGEQLVAASGLPAVVVRLGAVLPLDPPAASLEPFRLSSFIPLSTRVEATDPRDVGRALVAATDPGGPAIGRTLLLGGGSGWRMSMGELYRRLYESVGMGAVPEDAFRRPHPDVDDAWYGLDFVDSEESQRLLDYQRHSVEDFLAEVRHRLGWRRAVAPLAGPLMRRLVLRRSPCRSLPAPDPVDLWTRLAAEYGIDPAVP